MNFEQYDPNDENQREALMSNLRMIIGAIAFIDPEALEAHLKWSRETRSRQDAWGSLVDPTAYIKALNGGVLKDQLFQEDMLAKLVELSQLCQRREREMAAYR